MGSILRTAVLASVTALTIAANASAVPGTAFAHARGRGFHGRFTSDGFGRGGLYIAHYGYDSGGGGYGWGLDRLMASAYHVRGSYLDGDYSIYPYGSW